MTEAEIMKALEDQKGLYLANGVFAYDALALINRKNAEIEQFADIGKMYSEIKAEAKAEAIKEFAERVKEESILTDKFGEVILSADIDQIAKEMGVE